MTELEEAKLVIEHSLGGRLALLTTADEENTPHATWMATFSFIENGFLIALTSPDSGKVRNIEENPLVEWLFTSIDFQQLVYLRGRAEVERDPVELKKLWEKLPGVDRAFFLKRYNSFPGFSIIQTSVTKATLVYPEESRSKDLDVDELLGGLLSD